MVESLLIVCGRPPHHLLVSGHYVPAFASLFRERNFKLPTSAVCYVAIKEPLLYDFQLTLDPCAVDFFGPYTRSWIVCLLLPSPHQLQWLRNWTVFLIPPELGLKVLHVYALTHYPARMILTSDELEVWLAPSIFLCKND